MNYQITIELTSTVSKDVLQVTLDEFIEQRDLIRMILQQTGGQMVIHSGVVEQITKPK